MKFHMDIDETIKKEVANRDAERARDKMIREMIAARQHLRDEEKKVLDEAQENQTREELEEYKRRRDLQLAEINVFNHEIINY